MATAVVECMSVSVLLTRWDGAAGGLVGRAGAASVCRPILTCVLFVSFTFCAGLSASVVVVLSLTNLKI